jgi:hypothetical protein
MQLIWENAAGKRGNI